MDSVLNRHVIFLEILFEEICKQRPRKMSCEEFRRNFCRAALNHQYDDHALRLIFSMSRLYTGRDELMTFEDFLEALLRLGVTSLDNNAKNENTAKRKKKNVLPRRQTIASTPTTRRSQNTRRRSTTHSKRRKHVAKKEISPRLALPVEYDSKGVTHLDGMWSKHISSVMMVKQFSHSNAGTKKTCGMKSLVENEHFQHSLRSLEIGLDMCCDVENVDRLAVPLCVCSMGNMSSSSYFTVTLHQGGTSLRTSLRLCDSDRPITIRSERPRNFFGNV